MRHILILSFLAASLQSFASIQKDACKTRENTRHQMNIIASNMANLNTTRTPEGGPYRKKELICVGQSCEVKETFKVLTKYEPDHPDANANGYVSYPDINLTQEMKAMVEANRAYEEAAKNCKI